MTKKSDLEKLIPEYRSIETSIGEIEIKPFTLAELRKCGDIIAKLSGVLKFNDLATGGVEVDAGYLIYVVFDEDMDLAISLLKISTQLSSEELDKLTIPESFAVMEAIAEICVMPAIKEAGKSLKKIQGGKKDSPGATSSPLSDDAGTATPEA